MSHTIEIADHLWEVLATMSRDMATEPRALVNQAVFNWARRNGYTVTAPGIAPAATAVPVAAPAATPTRAPGDALPVVVEKKAAPAPVAVAVAAAPAVEAKSVESVAKRIAAIDADVDAYCLARVVVDAEFGDDEDASDNDDEEVAEDEDDEEQDDEEAEEEEAEEEEAEEEEAEEEEAEVAAAPAKPPVDMPALRMAEAMRVAAIDKAVDDVLPRPQARPAKPAVAAAAPAPVPAPAPAPARAPVPAQAAPAAAAKPAATVEAPVAAPDAAAKGRQRLDTSELNNLLGEVDDILKKNIRDTTMSPAMRFVLELRVRGTDQLCTVTTAPVIIGRAAHCDLIVESAEVSREHAVITRVGATYVIEDRGSSNGTWINNASIKRHEIHSGDVIRVGSADLVASFRVDDAAAKAS